MDESEFQISLAMFVAASGIQLILGAAFGWLVRASRQPKSETSNHESKRVREALQQLHALTGSIGHNVDEHASRVEAINQNLAEAKTKGDGDLQTSLLAAMAQITEANERLQGQLNSAEKKLEEQAGKLESTLAEARTDALTGLSNRRAFDDELQRRLGEFHRYGSKVSMMLMDVDHFKKFNDTHGHLAGDEVLRGVARVLKQTVREVDLVFRYGGEEFAIVFPGTAVGDACGVADRIRAAVEGSRFDFNGTTLQVTLSGGLTEAALGDEPAAFIKRADESLYHSKKTGRNRVHRFDGKTQELITKVAAPAAPTPAPTAASEPAKASGTRTDTLTGLPNRQAFDEELNRRIAQQKRCHSALSLIIVDVDELHNVNDKYGREMGDIVLRAVTQFLTASMREMDLAARCEEDRFALLLPATDLTNALQAAERIRKAIGLCKLKIGESELQFTVSIGLAESKPEDDAQTFFGRCIDAVKFSQEAGRNCSFVHTGDQIEPIGRLCVEAT
jgi:diguanylate cyclase